MRTVYKLASLLVISFMLMLYSYGLDYNLMDYDEGAVYLYPNMLVHDLGLKPYVDFPYSQPPGMFGSGDLWLKRLGVLGYLVICCVITYAIGRKFGAGYFAVVFLITNPLVMEYSRIAVGDIPFIALMAVFLGGLFVPRDNIEKKYLIGGLIVFAFTMKVQALVICIPLLYYLIFVKKEYELTISFGIFIFGLIVLSILYPGILDDVIFDNLGVAVSIDRLSYLFSAVVSFVYKCYWILPFSVLGFVQNWGSKKRGYDILIVYVLTAFITILTHGMIDERHLMFTLPVLCVWAGVGLKSVKAPAFVIAVVLLSVFVPLNEYMETLEYDNETRAVIEEIDKYLNESDMIYTDEPMYSYHLGRRMPPSAHMWNGLGMSRGLKAETVMGEIDEYQPKVVALTTDVMLERMHGPRLYTTFGDDGDRIIDHLDENYIRAEGLKRNYQLVTIWVKNG